MQYFNFFFFLSSPPQMTICDNVIGECIAKWLAIIVVPPHADF